MDRIGRRDPARVIAIGGMIGLCFAAGSLTFHRITDSADSPGLVMSSGGHDLYGSLPADPWGAAPVPSRPPLASGASDMMAMAGIAPSSHRRAGAAPTPDLAVPNFLTCDRFPCETIPSRQP